MKECNFCKIVRGELPSEKVYENDHVYAFRDFAPQAPVHILVIPKKHIISLDDTEQATDIDLAECLRSVRLIAKQENLVNGYRVISNCGPDACQTMDHLHFHILGGHQMADKIVSLLSITECSQSELITPTADTYGYRWVYSNLHVYIVRIKINGPYCHNIFARNDFEKKYEYVTEDWTIDEIRDAILNKPVDKLGRTEVRAFMDNKVDYYVGNHVIGEPVFFCISVDDFKKTQMKNIKFVCDKIRRAKMRLFVEGL